MPLFAGILLVLAIWSGCTRPGSIKWVMYDETRCADRWETSANKEKLKENVISYCAGKGITIYEMEIFIVADPETCYDCVCRTGRQYKCKIKSGDLEEARNEGFYE